MQQNMKVQQSGETQPEKSSDQVRPAGNHGSSAHGKELYTLLEKTDCGI